MAKLDPQSSGLTVQQVYAEFDKLRVLRNKAVAAKGAYTKANTAWRDQMRRVAELSESEGISGGVRTREGAYEVPEPTWFANFQDFHAFEKWAEDNAPGMLRHDKHVPAQLNELIRELVDDERLQDLPPGVGAYPKTGIVKVKKAAPKRKPRR